MLLYLPSFLAGAVGEENENSLLLPLELRTVSLALLLLAKLALLADASMLLVLRKLFELWVLLLLEEVDGAAFNCMEEIMLVDGNALPSDCAAIDWVAWFREGMLFADTLKELLMAEGITLPPNEPTWDDVM